MPPEARREYKYRNWKNVFDLAYVDNGWIHRADSIQATLWELRKEDIKKVRFFTAATPKPKYLEAEEKRKIKNRPRWDGLETYLRENPEV